MSRLGLGLSIASTTAFGQNPSYRPRVFQPADVVWLSPAQAFRFSKQHVPLSCRAFRVYCQIFFQYFMFFTLLKMGFLFRHLIVARL